MSYNLLCSTDLANAAPRAVNRGLVVPVVDGDRDALYAGADCADYEAQLRGAGVYEAIIGVDAGSICR